EDWQEASRRVFEGEAGFNIMGDWAAGYCDELEAVPEEAYDCAASPGTDGAHMRLSDSVTLPAGAPHEGRARAWLGLVDGQDGRDVNNPLKGSSPAREDAGPENYADSPYLEAALQEWQDGPELAGSFWHGVTVGNRWKNDIDTAVGLYLQNQDLDELNTALHEAAQTE